jgi:tRNA dimethylallyltransferase
MLDGDLTEPEAIEDTARTTRRFARRQDTWFKRDDRVTWLPYDTEDLTAKALTATARIDP